MLRAQSKGGGAYLSVTGDVRVLINYAHCDWLIASVRDLCNVTIYKGLKIQICPYLNKYVFRSRN